MKALSISGLILSVLGLITALANQFHFKPNALALESGDSMLWAEAHHLSVLLGEAALITCGVAFLLALIAVFKVKSKLVAIIAIVLALVGIFLGLAQGTHMFS
jgi:hypothetical protein